MACLIVLVVLSHHIAADLAHKTIVAHRVPNNLNVSRTRHDVNAVSIIAHTQAVPQGDVNRLIQCESIESVVLRHTVLQQQVVRPLLLAAVWIESVSEVVNHRHTSEVQIVGELSENTVPTVTTFFQVRRPLVALIAIDSKVRDGDSFRPHRAHHPREFEPGRIVPQPNGGLRHPGAHQATVTWDCDLSANGILAGEQLHRAALLPEPLEGLVNIGVVIALPDCDWHGNCARSAIAQIHGRVEGLIFPVEHRPSQ